MATEKIVIFHKDERGIARSWSEVGEIVRCKDCKHNYSKKHNKRYNHEDIVCDYWETDGLNDDDFCSYGERSEE